MCATNNPQILLLRPFRISPQAEFLDSWLSQLFAFTKWPVCAPIESVWRNVSTNKLNLTLFDVFVGGVRVYLYHFWRLDQDKQGPSGVKYINQGTDPTSLPFLITVRFVNFFKRLLLRVGSLIYGVCFRFFFRCAVLFCSCRLIALLISNCKCAPRLIKVNQPIETDHAVQIASPYSDWTILHQLRHLVVDVCAKSGVIVATFVLLLVTEFGLDGHEKIKVYSHDPDVAGLLFAERMMNSVTRYAFSWQSSPALRQKPRKSLWDHLSSYVHTNNRRLKVVIKNKWCI